MSVSVAGRASDFKVLFDGQSLNYSPSASNNYTTKLMQDRGIHHRTVAVSGFAWVQLKNLLSARVNHYVERSGKVIVIGMGGTTDYVLNQTGAQVYASEVTWADNLRATATGPIYIIQTTTTPSTTITGTPETNRQAGNALVMSDASNAFDYSIDLAGDSRLSDPTNTTYYNVDGTHLTDAGAQVVADLIEPTLEAILAL